MTIRKTIRSTIRRPYFDLVKPGSGLKQEPEVVSYIAGLTTPLSAGQITKLNTFVSALKTGMSITNLSDAFDVMYILAGETAESSLKNLVKNAHHCTAVNSPTFTQFEGWKSNGSTNYLDTNYNFLTDRVNVLTNNSAGAIYTLGEPSLNFIRGSGLSSTGYETVLGMSTPSAQSFSAINSITGVPFGNLASTKGLILINRTASNIVKGYLNNIIKANSTTASAVPPSLNVYILNVNPLVASYGIQVNTSFIMYSRGLSVSDINVITNAVEWYMDSNGKGVIA